MSNLSLTRENIDGTVSGTYKNSYFPDYLLTARYGVILIQYRFIAGLLHPSSPPRLRIPAESNSEHPRQTMATTDVVSAMRLSVYAKKTGHLVAKGIQTIDKSGQTSAHWYKNPEPERIRFVNGVPVVVSEPRKDFIRELFRRQLNLR